jgi:hypothetical protein
MSYTQSFGSSPDTVAFPHIDIRAPSAQDILYGIGQRWINKVGNSEYVLTSHSASQGVTTANWLLLAQIAGTLDTLTGDTGGAITPSAGNIDLLGTVGEIITTGTANTITFSLDPVMITPGSLEVTGLLTADASALINTAGTALNLATDNDTAAVNLGTVGARTITVGNITGGTAVAVNTGTGGFVVATTGAGDIILNSDDTVLIDADGVLELNSSAGVIGIGNDADAQNINIGTGAAARTITIGNITTATGIVLNSGTGGVAINTTSTGDVVVASADTVLIDAAGVLELNSSAGVISIGNDNVNQNINVGTAGTRTIAIGSSAATETILGTTNINATGAGVTTIGTGGTGAVNIGNATGNTAVTGSLTATTTLRATLGAITATNGNVVLGTAGNKIISTSVASTITAGANSFGTVALVAGSAIVATTAALTGSIILLTIQALGTVATPMPIGVTARTNGVSFTITSTDGTDTSSIGWMIIN